MITPTAATVAPPSVTWISERVSGTAWKRRRMKAIPHQHMHCRRCGAVADLDARIDAERALGAARRRGFRPDGAELVVSGLCRSCSRR